MQSNQSQDRNKNRGLLTMAFSHIGHTEDTPSRTLEALKHSDVLVFEEDRPARLLLKLAQIHKPYLKLNEHKGHGTHNEIKAALKSGKSVIYCSDQGAPNLADPGQALLSIARQLGSRIKVIPGPSSITSALAVCPFNINTFTYLGFLPREANKRESHLKKFTKHDKPMVILDTPYRFSHLIEGIKKCFGPQRQVSVSIDISGEQETHWSGPIATIPDPSKKPKHLNFVVIVNGLSK